MTEDITLAILLGVVSVGVGFVAACVIGILAIAGVWTWINPTKIEEYEMDEG